MPDVGFGGNAGSAFSGYQVYSNGIGLPTGRVHADGGTGCIITGVGMYVAGRSGGASCYLYVGSAATGTIGLGNGGTSTHDFTGYIGASNWYVNGGSAQVGFVRQSGTVNFGRSSTSGATGTYDTNGSSWSGIIGGAYRYVEAPTAPGIVSVTPNADGDQATIVLSAPGDNGGTPVSGYRIQRATNSAFTAGVATVDSTGTTVMTGLTPGQQYWYRATARNQVTDTGNKLGGAWSGTATATQPESDGFGRVYQGGVFQVADARVRNPANDAWVVPTFKRRNAANTAWEDVGY